eukprot:scaffold140_cov565-Prasinococcus_capsulatus_cf.AAC.33
MRLGHLLRDRRAQIGGLRASLGRRRGLGPESRLPSRRRSFFLASAEAVVFPPRRPPVVAGVSFDRPITPRQGAQGPFMAAALPARAAAATAVCNVVSVVSIGSPREGILSLTSHRPGGVSGPCQARTHGRPTTSSPPAGGRRLRATRRP